MDRIDAMRVFIRVVEQRSFTQTAQDLNLPRSSVTDAVKQLEKRLNVRLLQRTTRHVSPTLDGEAYYQRCLQIIADIEDAEMAFANAKPRGLLRIDVQGTLARHFVLPQLPDFIAQYPDIELFISEGDRLVDLIREGFDGVLRVGNLQDSDMVARRVALLPQVTCAAPRYLQQHGTPLTPNELAGHQMVGFRSSATGGLMPLEFCISTQSQPSARKKLSYQRPQPYLSAKVQDMKVQNVKLPAVLSVSGAESFVAAARLALGIIQVPRYHIESDLRAGTLIDILPEYAPPPMPVSFLYPRNRQLSPRVRIFSDWLNQVFLKAFS
ncbi:bacterial regulatory helix-turn-helix, lysR family protein [Yersinia rochesterensis]|uniref:Bacterial regulatory helix-turn-helix, lysR family protein n=1 Tax=Yersinia rochesterensis TaxID=1604335 RepID=A0A386HES3_9GAMM|nr:MULTISPECIES: LysR family transcriptional regulator [Yersinia]AJI86284.1 bacterial regulatory helix-turn-helix, lysR family protein [Yersinia frederiksenii Y225]CNH35471.1 LysR family regulatory protein [Yersinia kristensenii]AIN18904.1 bacterial regulatory helix-turn-helix, lysR family protein [Yersinia rochesterensis]AJJ37554.1 bacterial regulatory helix-turn-helix, lysR family protein [Yersinia rochesterensis]AYD44109.1 LysR family transcriptional regulator [Yersinia rochesterensis]